VRFGIRKVQTRSWQAAEKRPSAALPSSLVVATYGHVRLIPL